MNRPEPHEMTPQTVADYITRGPSKYDPADVLAGRARMARARLNADQPLDDIDRYCLAWETET